MKPEIRRFVAFLIVTLCIVALAGCDSGPSSPATEILPVAQATATSAGITATALPLTPTLQPSPVDTEPPFVPLSLSAPGCDYGGTFKRIEALDRYTVRFSLCEPDVAFLEKLAFPTFAIQPRHWLEATRGGGPGSPLLDQPVGTGPYRVLEWKRGELLTLQSFDGYWGQERARTPRIIFRWSPDAAQRLVELQAGTANGIDNPDRLDWDAIRSDRDLSLLVRPPLSISMLGLNYSYPPFDQEKVRQALAMGIDRQRLVADAFPSGYEVAQYFSPCILPNACVGEPWYAYDPHRARELLAEAGFADGFTTALVYRDVVRGYLPNPGALAEALQAQLRQNLGIRARLTVMESGAFLQAVDQGQLNGLFLLGWGADYPDVTNFLDTFFGAQASLAFGDPYEDVTAALEGGASQANPQERQTYYQAANNAIRLHVPAIPLAQGGWIRPSSMAVAYQKGVQGAQASPLGFERFALMSLGDANELVWMQETEPRSLYCADEAEIDTLRACSQVSETLYRYRVGEATVEPALAEICQPDASLVTWTCSLRQNVQFQDGTLMDANDVVMSLIVQWDAAHPLHTGHSGEFAYFKFLWGNFLHAH